MRKLYSVGCLLLLLICTGGDALARRVSSISSQPPPRPVLTREVKVYLVALGDNGKTGKKIGCDDSLVAVRRTIRATASPLKPALEQLLSVPRDYNEQLKNFWSAENLKVRSVVIRRGIATVRISGEGPPVAGVCDIPRITSQIEETAKQFRTVTKVRVFVNGRTLAEAIR